MSAGPSQQLRTQAETLRRVARQIDACDIAALARRAGDDVWIGPTATACLSDIQIHGASLRITADGLRQSARHLEAQAIEIANAERAAELG